MTPLTLPYPLLEIQSGVRFCLYTDQSAVADSLHHMRHFFRTLAAAQRHSSFD